MPLSDTNNSVYKSPIGIFENYNLSAGKEFAVKFELPSKKKILKYDTKKLSKNPNFIQPEIPKIRKEVVNGNLIENNDKGICIKILNLKIKAKLKLNT